MPGAAARWQRIASQRGPAAWALTPLALLYGIVLALRRAAFDVGLRKVNRLPVPVVVVGNLVVGGAGKTPTVIALVERLRRSGRRPGVVSRGHGGDLRGTLEVLPDTPAARCGDEPLLIRRRTGVPVVVGADRVAAARALLEAHPDVDVIVADDGLQHRRLARDVQVIVFDERGAGNGWLLPAGPLREPLPPAPGPIDVVLYNAPRPTTRLPGHLAERRIAGVVRLEDWWRGAAPQADALTQLADQAVIAAAGIARPDRFFDALRAAGLRIEPLPLPDHARYDTLPWPRDARHVVVTEKDAVKLDPLRMAPTTVWVATLDFVLPPAFEREVLGQLERAAAHRHGNTPP